jgi:hypothetical protein
MPRFGNKESRTDAPENRWYFGGHLNLIYIPCLF